MSKLGKKTIILPKDSTIKVDSGNLLISGPKGSKTVSFNEKMFTSKVNEKNEFQINPDGGYKHFGNVNGDFIVVKGSVPGTYRRLIKLRQQIRNEPKKITKPNVLEVVLP